MHLSFFLFYFYLFIVRFTQLAGIDDWGEMFEWGEGGKGEKKENSLFTYE